MKFVKRFGVCAAVVLAALLALGCGGGGAGDSGSSQGPGSPGGGAAGGAPVACTEIGCDSGLFLDLSPIGARMPDVRQVKVCLDDRCQTFSPKESLAMIVDRKLDSEQDVTVTLTATDAAGHVVLRESRSVRSQRAQPNGPGCPPVWFQVPLELDPKTLHLVPRSGA